MGEFAAGDIGSSGQAIPSELSGTPFFVDTFAFKSNQVNTFGTESLLVHGPLSLQTEGMVALVDQHDGPPIALPGFYTQVGYFLTGEHRPYDRALGQIDRVKPFENCFWARTRDGNTCHGCGAVELAARVSYVDLNDANIRGGTLTDATLGFNWYLNPYCKVVGNYIHAWLDHPTKGESDTNIYAIRTQMDF